MTARRKVWAWICDACGHTEVVTEDPVGFRGRVHEVQPDGSGCRADWYACNVGCIPAAIRKALEGVWDTV